MSEGLDIKHKVHTSSKEAAFEIAELWIEDGWIVEIRPPSMIASDEWYVSKKEWSG